MDTTMSRGAFLWTSTAVALGLRLSESILSSEGNAPASFRSKSAATGRAAIGCVACIVAAMCLEVGCAYVPSSPYEPASPEREFSRTLGAALGIVGGGILGYSIALESVDDLEEAIVIPFVGVAIGAIAGGMPGYLIGDFIGFLVEEEEEETEWYPSTYNWDANGMYILHSRRTDFGFSRPENSCGTLTHGM